MSQDATDEDGQLHTLGLLERLRAETRLFRGQHTDLYDRVDKLLREIENPNLHDIANMNYRVELWDEHALHIRWTIGAIGHVSIAQAAFDEAVAQFPNERLALRNGILVLREHVPARNT